MLGNLWIFPAVMTAAFVFTLFFAKRLRVPAHVAGLLAVFACLVMSVTAGLQWHDREEIPLSTAEHTEQMAYNAGSVHSVLEAIPNTSISEKRAATGAEAADDTAEHEGEIAVLDEAKLEAGFDAAGKHEELVRVPVVREWTWFDMGNGPKGVEGSVESGEHRSGAEIKTSSGHGLTVKFGTRADGLSIVMLFTVAVISLMVHVFSIGYLRGDKRYNHYFAALGLFTGGMMMMVVSSTTLGVLFGWEMMGLCSFMLIGHWWEDRQNSDAALKAFFTTRTGDIGLLVGFAMLFFIGGQTFDIAKINYTAIEGGKTTMLTVACAALLLAVIGKSAQFPLHTWLPDAMAGPTPASALIHAATMVVAGVYLVLRLYPTFWTGFNIGGGMSSPIAIVGGITIVIAALLAFVQQDLKKVLAYSTVSQLGFMVMSLGVGGWTAALFHLFTHAFFKALLFLGAGSVSEGCHHTFDMREMGGLRKFMPTTYKTFLIGTLALAGVPPLAGFFSKDEILVAAGGYNYKVFMFVGLLGAGLTTMYMTRAMHKTFFGEYRGHAHPHESPRVLTLPLLILSAFALVAGLVNLPQLGHPLDKFTATASNLLLYENAHLNPVLAFSWPKAISSVVVVLIGFGLAYGWNVRKLGPQGITERNAVARGLHKFLVRKYYLDDIYTDGVVAGIKGPIARAAYWTNQNVIDGVVNGVGSATKVVASGLYKYVDQKGVDGAVNGIGIGTSLSGRALRKLQSGQVQQYAAWLFAGAAMFVLYVALHA